MTTHTEVRSTTHTEVRSTTYYCSKCNKTSKTKGSIQTHINSNVCQDAVLLKNIIMLKCEVCGKECETDKLMTLHKNNCVKKRVQVINDDINGELRKQNEEILKIILLMKNQMDLLCDENKELKIEIKSLINRIEVLESKKSNQELEKVNPDSGNGCEYSDIIKFKPMSREHFEEMHGLNDREIDESVTVILNGENGMQREADVYEDHLKVGNIRYYFSKQDITRKDVMHSSKLTVVINKYCKNLAVYATKKGCLCEEHL